MRYILAAIAIACAAPTHAQTLSVHEANLLAAESARDKAAADREAGLATLNRARANWEAAVAAGKRTEEERLEAEARMQEIERSLLSGIE